MEVRKGGHPDRAAIASVILSRVGFHTERRVVEGRVAQMVNRARKRPGECRLLVAGREGAVEGFGYAERAERFELFTAPEEAVWMVQYVAAAPGPLSGRVYVALLRGLKAACDAPVLFGAWTHRALQGGRGLERLGRLYGRLGMRHVASAWEW